MPPYTPVQRQNKEVDYSYQNKIIFFFLQRVAFERLFFKVKPSFMSKIDTEGRGREC